MKTLICLLIAGCVYVYGWNWGLVPVTYAAVALCVLAKRVHN